MYQPLPVSITRDITLCDITICVAAPQVAFWKQAARAGQPPTIIFATVSERDRDELAGASSGRGYASADRAAVGIR